MAAFLLLLQGASMKPIARWSIAVIALTIWFVSPLLAQQPDKEKYEKAAKRGLEWLKAQQQMDGSWSAKGQSPVTLTALAGLALLGEGSTIDQGVYKNEIRKAADWLIKRSNNGGPRDGLIGDPNLPAGMPRYMVGHGFAMVFLSQVFGEEDNKQ